MIVANKETRKIKKSRNLPLSCLMITSFMFDEFIMRFYVGSYFAVLNLVIILSNQHNYVVLSKKNGKTIANLISDQNQTAH